MAENTTDPFLAGVPVLDDFSQIADPARYVSLPDSWLLGLADVVHSTEAIDAGRYKTVNMAGAAVIAATANALDGKAFPFVFGGDGASFAVPPEDQELAAEALATTAVLVSEQFGLELRVALVPVSAVRAAGLEVCLAFFAASPDVSYAMFMGGGLAWAEGQMKEGAFALPTAPPGARPDLSGLSCRFEPMQSRHGLILSLIVRPAPEGDAAGYRALIEEVLRLVETGGAAASPVPPGGPGLRWPPPGLALEGGLGSKPGGLTRRLWLLAKTAGAHLLFRYGIRLGSFDPRVYVSQLVRNSDYRKYDDGLRMTIDCSEEVATRIELRLRDAQDSCVALYGLHRQASAMMTCFTPSVHRRDHVHFVDGAAGGYATAALQLKRQAAGA